MDGETLPRTGPEAGIAAVFIEAGWAPHFGRGGYSRQTASGWLVGGAPDPSRPLVTHMKITDKDPDTPDTPDDPVEAARWLVARERALADRSTEATLEPRTYDEATREYFEQHPEPEYDAPHETHGETGEAERESASENAPATRLGAEGLDLGYRPEGDAIPEGDAEESDDGGDAPILEPIDADFEDFGDLKSEDALDLGEVGDYRLDPLLLGDEAEPSEAPATEAPGSQFIFGDNLDQMRTAAIGLVMRHARSLMPFWTTDSDVALIELRNFTMGVSEGRWPDDTGRRADLDQLEATLSRIGAITQARDAKVEFLESASREEIEAFDYAAGWPGC